MAKPRARDPYHPTSLAALLPDWHEGITVPDLENRRRRFRVSARAARYVGTDDRSDCPTLPDDTAVELDHDRHVSA